MFKKFAGAVVVGVSAGVAMVGSAHAALDASIGTGITAVVTDATALQALIVPAVVTVLGLSLVVKLIKRFGNKI